MGLFDSLKDMAMKGASDALDKAKNEATNRIGDEIKEKSAEAITGGVKSYLSEAKEKVDNEEGKEGITLLENLIDDAENVAKTASDVDSSENDEYMKKAEDDWQKLSEFADKQNQ